MSDFALEVEENGLEHYPEDALLAFYEDQGTLEDFEDSYCGRYEGRDEYAAIGNYLEELEEEMGTMDEIPSRFRFYIDWYHMGRDARFNGEFWAEQNGYQWYVFRSY